MVRAGPQQRHLGEFFAELGDHNDSIQAVSIDMSVSTSAPSARPSRTQILRLPTRGMSAGSPAAPPTRSAATNGCTQALAHRDRPLVKGTRWSLLDWPADDLPTRRSPRSSARTPPLPALRGLRLLYRLDDPNLAPEHLDAWLAWATRSRLPPFVRLARTLREHREGILAAIRLGLSNGRLEASARGRPIRPRSFDFHAAAVASSITHCRYRPAPMNFTHKRTRTPYMSQAVLLARRGI